MRAFLFVFLMVTAHTGWAGERTLVVQLAPGVTGPSAPLPLFFDQRLTFVLPERVRLAVAGSADVLVAHVNDNVVVASLIDSEYVRAARPRTNLTILTEGGTAFTCGIEVAATAEATAVQLVEVKAPLGQRQQVSAEAVALVKRWLADPGSLDAATAGLFSALEPDLLARARRELAGWVGLQGFEALAGVQRTRQDFIYLTSYGLARIGDRAILRLTAINHSQPALALGPVHIRVDGQALPDDVVTVARSDAALPPDGEPRSIGVIFPADRLGASLVAEVCEEAAEPRCVRLDLR